MKSCFLVVLIYIFLVTNDVKLLFTYLLVVCISYSEKCLFKSFTHCFKPGCLSFLGGVGTLPFLQLPQEEKEEENSSCCCIIQETTFLHLWSSSHGCVLINQFRLPCPWSWGRGAVMWGLQKEVRCKNYVPSIHLLKAIKDLNHILHKPVLFIHRIIQS